MTSVFTKIINGEEPAHIIWQDSEIISFLPNNHFVNPGHILVVPKIEIDYIFDLDDELYQKMWAAAKFLPIPLKKVTKSKRIGIAVEGFSVPHVHIHLCPINAVTQLDPHRNEEWPKSERENFTNEMHKLLKGKSYV